MHRTAVNGIGELERQLAEVAPDTPAGARRRIDLLNGLAWALNDIDMPRAQALSEEALALAESPAVGPAPYAVGIAYSLRTQGYLNQRRGEHATGLRQLFRAQELCQSLGLADGLVDVLDGFAGIFVQMGDYEEGFTYAYRQLEAAQRMADGPRTANAQNNVGALYCETGDYAAARDTFQRNLRYAEDAGDRRIEFLSHVNLVDANILLGELDAALEHGQQALRTSRQAGFVLFEVYALVNLGRIQMALGAPKLAVEPLTAALVLSRRLESKVTDLAVLLHLGETYREVGQLDLALACLGEAEAIARAVDARSELVRVHLRLASVYEDQGDYPQALSHLKQHNEYKELVTGEKAEQRVQVLRIAHDADSARREAVLEERRRLARDLHDSVSQTLYSLTLFGRSGREAAEDGDAVRLRHCLADVERYSLHALREMRLLLYELRPVDLGREGLVRALQARLESVERRTGLRLDVGLDERLNLSTGAEAELYQIAVEALNNVVKHAGASTVSLHLTQVDGALRLSVGDDGQGFNPATTRDGLGLRGIRERVAILGGELTIESAPGSGTRVTVVIPYPAEVGA